MIGLLEDLAALWSAAIWFWSDPFGPVEDED
jgi:hypothetical protein